MGSQQDRPAPGRRDPEGRRRAIIAAAAELIVEGGAASITHRAVAARAEVSLGSTTQYFTSLDELREAALQALAEDVDVDLARVADQILPLESAPERFAAVMHEFLTDTRQVRAEIELMGSGMTDPRLRDIARRWTDRLTEILTEHVGREAAEAIAVYLDGVTLHAGLHDEPIPADAMARTLRALMTIPPSEGSDPR
ncbi:TetR/AcrR family transcriptional regulator [Janibacter limosus]|uniref:TetR family transcriptional regulator n=1 Tax=Janibacter limosus TaxID=53458 RepID=A0A4P6MZR7_9MICO|nr:TetR family transcriptional regulator [Janibacter limosus]QBF47685.1 TetR family transcriptional regulator [Janibacter limosus]